MVVRNGDDGAGGIAMIYDLDTATAIAEEEKKCACVPIRRIRSVSFPLSACN